MANFPEVGVKLVADGAGKYIADLGRAAGATDGLGKSATGASGMMGGFASSLGTVGGILTGGLLLGLGAATVAFGKFTADGISGAIDLEHQMSGIAAVLKKTADEVQPLQELISELALNPNLTVNTTQAAAAIEMLARNGLTMEQIMAGAAEGTIALANATGGEFSLAADVMTDAMAQFGIESGDLEQVIDGITGVVNNSKFTMDDFAYALAQGGGVAATVGVEFDDFTTAIAVMSPLFASGSDAGTSFKTMLTRLVPASGPAADAMSELGILAEDGSNAFFDAEGNLKSMADISGVLNSALAGLSEEQKNAALSTIFGSDAMRAAAALAGITAEEFETMSENINTSGQAFQSAGTRVDNVKGAMEILGGIFEALGIQLGQKLLPFIRQFVDWAIVMADTYGTVVIEAISATVDAIAGFIANLQEGMAPLDAFIEAIWNIAPQPVLDALIYLRDDIIPGFIQPLIDMVAGFVQVEDIMIALGIAIGVFVLPIIGSLLAAMFSIIAPIIAVIAVVALARTAWEENWGGIQEKTVAVWVIIQDVFTQLSAWVMGTLIPTVVNLYKSFQTNFDTIKTVVQNWWTVVSTIFGELGRWINENIVPWVEFLAKIWLERQLAMAKNIENSWAIIKPIWEAIKGWLGDELQKTLESFGAKWALIMLGLEAPINVAKSVFDTFVGAVKGFWDWISSKTFEFNISIPDLPDWAVPGSPLPIHTAWANFADDMNRTIIEPVMIVDSVAQAAFSPVSSPAQISNTVNNRNTTVNFTGNYSSSPEVTDGATLTRVMAGYA
jgi:TP901 family phage tail tape measure protein